MCVEPLTWDINIKSINIWLNFFVYGYVYVDVEVSSYDDVFINILEQGGIFLLDYWIR